MKKKKLATDKRVYYISLASKVKQPVNENMGNELLNAVNENFTVDELKTTAKVLKFLTDQINQNK